MPTILKVISIILFGNTGWTVVFTVAYIVGLWRILLKCGISGSWALVPFAREYMFAKAARRTKAGIVMIILHLAFAAISLFTIMAGDRIRIVNFTLPAAALSLVAILLILIYSVIIYKGLIEVFGVRRRWVYAWLFFQSVTAIIWGFSKKFGPVDSQVHEKPELTEIEIPRSWFGNLGLCLNMSFDRFFLGGKWKSLPIAVAITVLVASIARNDFFQTMEGTIKGSLALTCIAIWNGCFNSILSVCEDREKIIALRGRGLRISSFIVSSLFSQALLCLCQTALVMYSCVLIGISFPAEGMISPSLISEIGITIFLITYAADMMSLCVSALVKKPVSAMMIMPFLLVIQLVFSGSVINVAAWSNSISRFTISNYGVKCIAAQADYNDRPMVLGWNLLESIEDNELRLAFTAGQIMDVLQDEEGNPEIRDLRSKTVEKSFTVGEIRNLLLESESVNEILDANISLDMSISEFIDLLMEKDIFPDYEELWEIEVSKTFTVKQIYEILNHGEGMQELRSKTILFDFLTIGSLMDIIAEVLGDQEIEITLNFGQLAQTLTENEEVRSFMEKRPLEDLTLRKAIEALKLDSVIESYSDETIEISFNVGAVIDSILAIKEVQGLRDKEIRVHMTIGDIIDRIGTEKVEKYVIEKTTSAMYVPEYAHKMSNVYSYWGKLALFILVFGLVSSASVLVLMKRRS
ncbi:MAG: ABC transporter permease [Spirochaetales bacterium]|nr:ABC transporter permease [Spirochaetales bacterium]